MRILLVRPPRIKQAITLSDFMFSEPLGLEMIAGALKEKHEIEIFDGMIETISLSDKIKSFKPAVIGITSLCTDVKKVIELCKETKLADRKIETVVGGTQAYLDPEAFFNEAVDHIFHYTSRDNLQVFYDGINRDEVVKTDGVLSRIYKYESTGVEGRNQYLLPDRTFTEKYRREYSYFGYKPAAIMEFGTGCEKVCDFCLRWRIEGAKEELIDLDLTKKDLQRIKEKTIMFIDNDFFASREKIEAFIGLVKELNMDKNYIVYGSVAGILACEEYMQELKIIGLKAVLIGYETFRDEELIKYHKKTTTSDNLSVSEIMKQAGIDVWASFMANPDWSVEDFKGLRGAIKKLKPQITTISPLTPFPNLPMYELYKERLLYKRNDYEKWSFGQVMIKPGRISLKRYYYELLKTNLYVNMRVNNNPEMIKTFGGKSSFRIIKGSVRAIWKYLVLMMKA